MKKSGLGRKRSSILVDEQIVECNPIALEITIIKPGTTEAEGRGRRPKGACSQR
jgi:hypothetical protein